MHFQLALVYALMRAQSFLQMLSNSSAVNIFATTIQIPSPNPHHQPPMTPFQTTTSTNNVVRKTKRSGFHVKISPSPSNLKLKSEGIQPFLIKKNRRIVVARRQRGFQSSNPKARANNAASLKPNVPQSSTKSPSSRYYESSSVEPTNVKSTKSPSTIIRYPPSIISSSQPSSEPSNHPGDMTTSIPSSISMYPTIKTSLEPTIEPSVEPNPKPFQEPSLNPSNQPSSVPSTFPTIALSYEPSTFPSVFPSKEPSVTPTKLLTSKRPSDNKNGSSKSPSVNTSAPRVKSNESNTSVIGGIGLGIGLAGVFTLIVLLFRQTHSDDTVIDTDASDNNSISSIFPDPEENNNIHNHTLGTRYDNNTNIPADPSIGNGTDNRVVSKDMNFSDFSYSEDSSDVFKDLGISLASISVDDSTYCYSNGKSDVVVFYPSTTSFPSQQLRSTENVASQTKIVKKQETTDAELGSVSECSILQTDVLQSDQKNIARLLSCFSSSTLLKNAQEHLSQVQSNPSSAMFGKTEKDIDAISVVSSLSGRSSSCSEATIEFYGGTPYEVLVPAKFALGLVVKSTRTGPQIVHVKNTSPLHQVVEDGDFILSVDGMDCRHISAKTLSKWLHKIDSNVERTIILMGRKNSYLRYGQSMI